MGCAAVVAAALALVVAEAVLAAAADPDGLAFAESFADVAGATVRVAVVLLEPPPQADRPAASASATVMLAGRRARRMRKDESLKV